MTAPSQRMVVSPDRTSTPSCVVLVFLVRIEERFLRNSLSAPPTFLPYTSYPVSAGHLNVMVLVPDAFAVLSSVTCVASSIVEITELAWMPVPDTFMPATNWLESATTICALPLVVVQDCASVSLTDFSVNEISDQT